MSSSSENEDDGELKQLRRRIRRRFRETRTDMEADDRDGRNLGRKIRELANIIEKKLKNPTDAAMRKG